MATTTNYGWTTPDDTALVKDGAAAIRTLGTSIDTTTKNLNPSTTLGDIEYRSSTANTNTRLAIGSTGQVLTVAGGVPSWATPASGSTFSGVSLTKSATQSIANNTTVALTFDTETFDTNAYHDNSTNTDRITIPSGKAGYFLVNAQGSFAYDTVGVRYGIIKKNGTTIIEYGINQQGASVQATVVPNKVVAASVGDYFQFFVYQNTGGSLNILSGDAITFFTMTYLGA